MKTLKKQRGAIIILLCVLSMSLMLAGCGGGGGGSEGVSSQVISGVAAVGAPLAGEAKIKDSSAPAREKTTIIGSDGSFAFDVTDMKGPFILRAKGSVDGETHMLQSFADGPGTANINPLANAAVARAAGVDDPSEVYERPDHDRLNKIKSDLPGSITEILEKLRPLLRKFNADDRDPVRGHYKADHNNLDGLFDNVKITLSDGILTIINKKTGAVIFSGKVCDIKNGHLDDDDDNLPNPGTIPTAPATVTAVGSDGQVTVSWTAVGNATSYNLYWSTVTGVTKANGTKISGAANPYVQGGLTSGTTYYYIVTAVNSVGESDASTQGSATSNAAPPPAPTVPSAPGGVIATGGTKQATISWSAVPDATSYNVYWSTTMGVTKANGTKIAGVTSPTVLNGLADSTTYYYIVTAANSVGEGGASVQVAATTLAPIPAPTVPGVPTGVTAAGGTNQATVSWPAVSGATSYNIYWSANSGVTTSTGTKIAGVTSPYVQTGLSAGTMYYYIVTAVNSVGESAASVRSSATTNPPPPAVPNAPAGLTATGGDARVTISWAAASGATSYNIYWSTVPGVTTGNGTKIAGATSPYTQTGLAAGTAYYYIVTAANSSGESPASAPATAATNAPVPAIPAIVTAIGGANRVTVSWSTVSGATSYNIYWSTATGVTTGTGTRIAGVTSSYVHTGLAAGTAYYYIVTAVNSTGEGAPSAQAAATTIPGVPTGVTATGGAKQVTISWPAVSGAASYNLYWSAASGVTTGTGTRITGVPRPYLHTGLADSTAYYYIVTAVNSAGEGSASVQVTATTNAAPPPALDGVALYGTNCQRCHGSLASTDIIGRTLQSFKSANMTRGLADDALLAIIAVLP